MATDDGSPSGRDQLREEAATWFARMRGEDAEQHKAGFEAWLARGAVHRAAYNRIGEVFAAGKALKNPQEDARTARPTGTLQGLMPIVLIAPTALLSGLVGWHLHRSGDHPSAHEETHAVASSDSGSTTTPSLQTLRPGVSTLVDVDGSVSSPVAGQNAVTRLERGRARFVVSGRRDPQHVLAGPGEATSANGTFDLWLRADGSLQVQVLRGTVAVRPAVLFEDGGSNRAPVRLRAGQRYCIALNGAGQLMTVGVGHSWPDGVLEYRQTPLAAVVEEANRYSATKIVLGDPRLATRQVSGRFRVDDASILADRLAGALTLVAVHVRAGVIVLRAH